MSNYTHNSSAPTSEYWHNHGAGRTIYHVPREQEPIQASHLDFYHTTDDESSEYMDDFMQAYEYDPNQSDADIFYNTVAQLTCIDPNFLCAPEADSIFIDHQASTSASRKKPTLDDAAESQSKKIRARRTRKKAIKANAAAASSKSPKKSSTSSSPKKTALRSVCQAEGARASPRLKKQATFAPL